MKIDRRSSALAGALAILIAIAVVVTVRLAAPGGAPDAGETATGEPNFDIYVYDIASGTDRRLTTSPNQDIDPEWSPDGTQIAFARYTEGDLHDLYLMDADGSNERVLLGGPSDDIKPSWSPDGREIVFMSDRSSFGDLYVVDVATGDVRVKRIARSPTADEYPAWSPSGEEIAFVAMDRKARKTHIFTVAPDGTNKRMLRVFNRCCRWLPHVEWSPDGRWLALTWQPKDQADVWIMSASGKGEVRRLTHGTAGDGFASWSPDGDEIVFQTNRHTGNGDDLYVIGLDGSAERALVRTPWIDANPDWSPDGSSIAFDSISGAG